MQPLIKLLLLSILLGLLPAGSIAQNSAARTRSVGTVVEQPTTPVDDDAIGRAFANRTSDVQVEGQGKVIRLLPDDMPAFTPAARVERSSRKRNTLTAISENRFVMVAGNDKYELTPVFDNTGAIRK